MTGMHIVSRNIGSSGSDSRRQVTRSCAFAKSRTDGKRYHVNPTLSWSALTGGLPGSVPAPGWREQKEQPMGHKNKHKDEHKPEEYFDVPEPGISKKAYQKALYELRVELVKLQRDIIANNRKILVLFEGRDAAGKDGTIKRIVRDLSPRETRVVALGKPSERESTSWYFQRFAAYLPAAQEMVLFNRSWYNRAGVERVMGFCTPEEYRQFMNDVPRFEQMLIGSGIYLLKYYLDISKDEQRKRLEDRRDDPLKQWKISPIDAQAIKLWDEYSIARNEMLAGTHTASSPWTVVRADNKKLERINLIRDLLNRADYADKRHEVLLTDPAIVFPYQDAYLKNGMIAP
jgi:polyphosphate kinase